MRRAGVSHDFSTIHSQSFVGHLARSLLDDADKLSRRVHNALVGQLCVSDCFFVFRPRLDFVLERDVHFLEALLENADIPLVLLLVLLVLDDFSV